MKFIFFLLTLGLLVVLEACIENPTSVGLGYLNAKDFPKIQDTTLFAASSSTVPSKIFTFGSDRLLLGKYSSYDAIAMLKFTGLPVGALDTVSIVNARIELHSVYHFGDSLASISFQGYKAIAAFDSATYDALTTLSSAYYSPNPISTVSSIILNDTSTISCPILDTALVHSWFTADTISPNNGIIFVSDNFSTVKGFGSFVNGTVDYRPKLVIDYSKNGTQGTVTYNSGVARYVSNIPQASLVSPYPQAVYIQSGVAYRGQLSFNLPSLPKPALIVKASLELTFDSNHSKLNSYAADTLYSYYVNIDSTIAAGPVQGQTLIVRNQKIYRFAVQDFVRAWAAGNTAQKLQFGGLRESSSLDLYAIFGTTSSPDSLRPRLIITSIVQ